MQAIYTKGLSKRYPGWGRSATALKGLDLDVACGEIFGYLGPNGAGKTTTLKLLMGFARPTSGRAWLFGIPADEPDARREVGFLPERPSLPGYLRCEEVLRLSGRLSGLGPKEAKRRTHALLESTGLEGVGSSPVRWLSKGMLQWLGLAQALVGRPRLLILDEPMSGLDPVGRRRMRDLILAERARGTTVFFSSHILADVEMICDRVGILLRGGLVQCGRLDAILDSRSEGLEIRVENLPGGIVERIRDLGGRARSFGAETLIEVDQGKHTDVILGWVREAGGRVRSLLPRRESLEEYFLRQVTGAASEACQCHNLQRHTPAPGRSEGDDERPVQRTVKAECP